MRSSAEVLFGYMCNKPRGYERKYVVQISFGRRGPGVVKYGVHTEYLPVLNYVCTEHGVHSVHTV